MKEVAYLNTHQAATALQVTHKQISALIRAGRLPASKLGRDWAIASDDLELVRERPKGRPRKDAGPRTPRDADTGSTGQMRAAGGRPRLSSPPVGQTGTFATEHTRHLVAGHGESAETEQKGVRGQPAYVGTAKAAQEEGTPVRVVSGGESMIIAVFGRKGGSGKTTCAFNLAGALAALGWRCLLVDLDGQASLTRALQDEPVVRDAGIGSRIMQFDRGLDDTIRTVGERLDLIPGDQSINGAAIALAENPTGALRLGGLLRPLGGRYEAIILDTAPNLGFSQNSALLGADVGVMPTRVGAQQDIDALLDTLAQREEQARFGLRVARITCILPSSYEDQHASQRVGLAALQERYGDLVGTPVPFSGLVERALNARVPLVSAYPRSMAAQSFADLADRLAAARVAA